MQIYINGFTFTKNNDVHNIDSILKKRDVKSLAGIIHESRKIVTKHHKKLDKSMLEFVKLILDETIKIHNIQKASKPRVRNKKKFSPQIYNVGN